jgi:hypothetical protein
VPLFSIIDGLIQAGKRFEILSKGFFPLFRETPEMIASMPDSP